MLEFPVDIPTYDILRAAVSPALDGWLDSPCWHGAQWVDRFITTETGQASGKPTCVALLWDDHYLYLGAKVAEPRLANTRAGADTPEAVWGDDALEIYLDPHVPEMEFLGLAINLLGQACPAPHVIDNPGWGSYRFSEQGGIRAAARFTGDGWQMEVAIPFGENYLPHPAPGATWRGNICRNDKLGYTWSFWSLREEPHSLYADKQTFPYLHFAGAVGAAAPATTFAPDWPSTPRFDMRGFMYDTSRGSLIYRRDYWEQKLPFMRELGLNTILMYFENHLRYDSHPEFAPEGSWTLAELTALQQTAQTYGIDVIPAQTSLGHCPGILTHPKYQHLAEDGSDFYQFCPAHPETAQVLGDIFAELSAASHSPYVSINADESAYLGLCPRCQEKYRGWTKGEIFREHILRLYEVITAHGKRMMMWDDMLWTFPEALDGLPRDIILLDWHYSYHRRYPSVDVWRNMGFDVVVCPGMSLVENAFWLADYGAQRGAMGMINTIWEEHSLPLGNYWHQLLATSWAAHAPEPASIDAWFAQAGAQLFGPAGARLGHSLAGQFLAGRNGYGGNAISPAVRDFAARQVLEEAEQLLATTALRGEPRALLEEFIYARRLLALQTEVSSQPSPATRADLAARSAALQAEGLARWHAQCTVVSQQDAFLERFTAIAQALAAESVAK